MAIVDNYTESELKFLVEQSSSYKELLLLLGYSSTGGNSYKIVKNRLEKYSISTEHFEEKVNMVRNEDNVFCAGSTASQATLRSWYFKGNYSPYQCSLCGIKEWQGKPLTFTLDHIDGDNTNNVLSNLRWICPNCDRQLPTYSVGKKRLEEKNKKYFCIDCGQEISKYGKRCQSCAARLFTPKKVSIEERPTREELKHLIRTTSFVQIGKKYGVSDNTIRKWCLSYNLPNKTHDIKKISNENWANI